jgi:hypothetical protein
MGCLLHDFKRLGLHLGPELASILGVDSMQVWQVPRRLA